MEQFIYKFKNENPTIFIKSNNRFWIKELFGYSCNFCGTELEIEQARGMSIIKTNFMSSGADDLYLKKVICDKNYISLMWVSKLNIFRIESNWSFCEDNGIWSRKDTIFSTGNKPITIFSYLASFVFSPNHYEVYFQGSRCCCENQGKWMDTSDADILLKCEGGATSKGNTPFACLREIGKENAIAFHIIPIGNWTIRIKKRTSVGPGYSGLPFTIVELGINDENLMLEFLPEHSIDLPEIFFYNLSQGEPHLGTSKLHSYLLKNILPESKKTPPVVFNNWFISYDHINVDILRKQLPILRDIGCEVFLIDAGWYGNQPGSWRMNTGDWSEKGNSAFYGKMKDFAKEVIDAGLGFGLWMEPEDIAPDLPVLQKHPEWFIKAHQLGSITAYRPNLEKKEVYNYMLAEISRLIETYSLSWIKIDFNIDFCIDMSGSEFYYYYSAWYHLLDELLLRFPKVFFEGCSSGALRSDLNTLKHFDTNYLSDNANPTESLLINQNLLLRFPPGRANKLIALKNINECIPMYGEPLPAPTEKSIITPFGSGSDWGKFESTTLDFAIRVGLLGILELTGDITNFDKVDLKRLKFHIDFFKKWRKFIYNSVAYLLTPPFPIDKNNGWVAVQLQQIEQKSNLLFVYRLDDGCNIKRFYLKGLIPEHKYKIENIDDDNDKFSIYKGSTLMFEGIEVTLKEKESATIFCIYY